MLIRAAIPSDIPVIHRLAHAIWPATYSQLMSAAQLRFMLDFLYSETALEQQFEEMTFVIVEREGTPVGFAAYSLADPAGRVVRLHKIYLLPSEQGKGTGKMLLAHVEDAARRIGGDMLELNVKRDNPALSFYQKQGLSIHQTVDIPFHGFELNDYVMRKGL